MRAASALAVTIEPSRATSTTPPGKAYDETGVELARQQVAPLEVQVRAQELGVGALREEALDLVAHDA